MPFPLMLSGTPKTSPSRPSSGSSVRVETTCPRSRARSRQGRSAISRSISRRCFFRGRENGYTPRSRHPSRHRHFGPGAAKCGFLRRPPRAPYGQTDCEFRRSGDPPPLLRRPRGDAWHRYDILPLGRRGPRWARIGRHRGDQLLGSPRVARVLGRPPQSRRRLPRGGGDSVRRGVATL